MDADMNPDSETMDPDMEAAIEAACAVAELEAACMNGEREAEEEEREVEYRRNEEVAANEEDANEEDADTRQAQLINPGLSGDEADSMLSDRKRTAAASQIAGDEVNPDWHCESVREDPWHYMNHLNGMSRHKHKQTPMYKLFMTMLSQAMFKFVEKSDDPKIATRDAVRAHLKKLYGKKQTPDQFADFLRHVPYAYWVSRCRRVMPEPEIMLRDVLDVYTAFLNLDDPDTKSDRFPYGEPFYKSNHEDTLCLQLKYICKGCLSDPPDFW